MLDVDRYNDLALVVALSDSETGSPSVALYLHEDIFQFENEEWRYLSGARGILAHDPFVDRVASLDRSGLVIRAQGSVQVQNGGQHISYAIISTSSLVSTVEIVRGGHLRSADVGAGPGWFGVVWSADVQPQVAAFGPDGEILATLSL